MPATVVTPCEFQSAGMSFLIQPSMTGGGSRMGALASASNIWPVGSPLASRTTLPPRGRLG